MTYSYIRNKLGVSNGCITNIAKKEKQSLPVENHPGQGRKKLTSHQEDHHLIKLMEKDRCQTNRQLASEWSASNGKSISARTIRRRLFEAGYKSYTTKRKSYRKLQHRFSRLKFARKHDRWTFNQWKNVIFSDESHFEVFNRKNRSYVRRLQSEADAPFNFVPRIQGGGGSVSVWGAMTSKGVGPLVFYDGRMNSQAYTNIIESHLLPYIEKNFKKKDAWHYIQDLSLIHI